MRGIGGSSLRTITALGSLIGWRMGGALAAALFSTSVCHGADHTAVPPAKQLLPYQERPANDDIIYFVLPDRFNNGDPSNDRGGLDGGRTDHGFDPTDKAFYHGGDLKGLTAKLDYLADLGITAIWFAPIYKNKPVQSQPGGHSAGYHGYWITDFTEVDPHFGTREELKTFVDEAHKRNMKVILDIITNHTADVIKFRECHDPNYQGDDKEGPYQKCIYRTKAEYPYWTRGDVNGDPINAGFRGDGPAHQTKDNFDRLTRMDYAYTPFVPDAEKTVKHPAWLNDPKYYHNRGETTFEGEDSLYGDFFGLDDLFTEHPRVRDGFIEIYKAWISDFKVDGFRVDTARHVNPSFWQSFVPAMLDHARAEGIPQFYIFGEVYDPDVAVLSRHTHEDGFPTVLDFAFQSTATAVLAKGAGTDELTKLFQADAVYKGGRQTAHMLPTFLGNHDMGRFGHFILKESPGMREGEVARRVILGHALMMFTRGVPVIYSGDEQGFAGDGHDQDARENMFKSRVAVYNDNNLIATDKTTADDNFDQTHPIYRAIATMAKIRTGHETLRRGHLTVRHDSSEPGLFAVSRLHPQTGEEIVFAVNTSTEKKTAAIEVEHDSLPWSSLFGRCQEKSTARGSYTLDVEALSFVLCKSVRP